jgi:hypothetical protein
MSLLQQAAGAYIDVKSKVIAFYQLLRLQKRMITYIGLHGLLRE